MVTALEPLFFKVQLEVFFFPKGISPKSILVGETSTGWLSLAVGSWQEIVEGIKAMMQIISRRGIGLETISVYPIFALFLKQLFSYVKD